MRTVALGFTEKRMPPGTHICQVYGSDGERADSILKFMLQGVQDGESCACFSDRTSALELGEHFAAHGADLGDASERGAFSLSTIHDIYFKDGEFDPDRMLALLRDFYDLSKSGGFAAARVIGEMSNDIHLVKGGSRLLEYESRVSLLLRECPVTAVCQYNAREFDGPTIMDVLRVHPLMVVRGAVVENPFFVPPEQFLT